MKKRTIVIFLVIMMLTMTVTSYGATFYNVVTSGIKIILDGKRINPKDANGNPVEPFIYNGTTYLPVRAVAEALGKEVYWDGSNYTVYLGEMNGTLQYPSVELENMTTISGLMESTNNLTDNYGNRYSRAVISNTMEFLTDMKYSRFKATLYVEKGAATPATKWIKIIADGKTIYTSPEITKSSRPINIDLNIKGYNDIKIEIERNKGFLDPDLRVHFGEAGFYQ